MKNMKSFFYISLFFAGALFQLSCSSSSNTATSPSTTNANSKDRTAIALAIDQSDNLYVLDQANACVRVYSGGVLAKTITGFTIPGQPNITLSSANAIAVDAAGNLYTVEGYELIKFDPNGNYLMEITGLGTAVSQFSVNQQGLAVDPARGLVFVGDDKRVLIFNTQGIFQGTFGNGNGNLTCEFGALRALAVDAQGCVYATDNGNKRIMQWCSCGAVTCFNPATAYFFPSTYSSGAAFNAVIDLSGNVFAADYPSNGYPANMIEFNSSGAFTNSWLISPPIYPQYTAVDSKGNIYEAYYDGLVREYSNNGSSATTIVSDQ